MIELKRGRHHKHTASQPMRAQERNTWFENKTKEDQTSVGAQEEQQQQQLGMGTCFCTRARSHAHGRGKSFDITIAVFVFSTFLGGGRVQT